MAVPRTCDPPVPAVATTCWTTFAGGSVAPASVTPTVSRKAAAARCLAAAGGAALAMNSARETSADIGSAGPTYISAAINRFLMKTQSSGGFVECGDSVTFATITQGPS